MRLPAPLIKRVFAMFIRRGHDDPERAAESLRIHWAHYAQHGAGPALVRQIRGLDVRDTLAIVDRLACLKVPARIVWGEDDQFQKLRCGERFARDLNAPLSRIEGGKHFTPEDHPDIIASEINALLADVRA